MKKNCIIFLLLIAAIHLRAQQQNDESPFSNKAALKVGYYGNVQFDNGLNLGAEYAWNQKQKVKQKRKGKRVIIRQFLVHGSLGYSTNFTTKNDNAVSGFSGLIWRRTNHKRWQLNVELNPLGFYRSMLPETFEVEGDGVSNVGLPGRIFYSPSIAGGIGRMGKGKGLSGWYLNAQYTFWTSFNSSTLPVFSLQFGHRFHFN
ncbi:MAG: hypothetical protein AB8F95_12250 [Bacteroidia bacterium]